MKLLWNDKDGGPESRGWVWGLEIKGLFSILLLRFRKGSRNAYHSHAFNAVSWLLQGVLWEFPYENARYGNVEHIPSWKPIRTPRMMQHKVVCQTENAWAITFRGPWADKWKEYLPAEDRHITLTHGRREV